MDASYLGQLAHGPARGGPTAAVAEASPPTMFARALLVQLFPDVDADRIISALLAEREHTGELPPGTGRPESAEAIAARDLHRLRAHVALGAAAHALQHSFNNPLTALLAEAQLLEMEPLAEEHRGAVRRILELARRLVILSRRLSGPDAQRVG